MQDEHGSLRVSSLGARVVRSPGPQEEVVFGRGQEWPHLLVGGDDLGVSREHGVIAFAEGQWRIRNLGRQPIRIAETRLLTRDDDPIRLSTGVTLLVVPGSRGREHPVEVHVAAGEGDHVPRPRDVTHAPRPWPLSPDERIVLIVLGQRYLYQEPHPQPLSWRAATAQLVDLQPDRRWNQGRIEHTVLAVRQRLSGRGVPGLTLEEVGEPVGNTLNHNLLLELLRTTTLCPADVDDLDRDF